MVFGDGREKTNYYGVHLSWDGRWLAVTASAGTAPRNDVWLADLATSGPELPDFTVVQTGVDAQTSIFVSRDGRGYVSTDRDAPRGRLAVVDPADPAYERWVDLLPEDQEAVLEDFADPRRPELGGSGVLLASWTRHAVGEVTVHDLADRRAGGGAAARCRNRSAAWASDPRAATRRGSATPTRRRRAACCTTTRRPVH